MNRNEEKASPRIGKFILDTISIGMYNNPLMALREYIQNSTDAIDRHSDSGCECIISPRIDVIVDGVLRTLTIKDTGVGLSALRAKTVLHDLGKSNKKTFANRGFRGIGRLGGLGYCDELRFITKAAGETVCSESVWDCKKLRELLVSESEDMDAAALIANIVTFSQHRYEKSKKDHFFTVEMVNVKSSKDVLLDVPIIKVYLSQIAPVPFDSKTFSFSEQIESELRSKVPGYKTYPIYVNDEQVFKPYKDSVKISQEHSDQIKGIQFKEFKNGVGNLAFGWIADLNLLGAINPSEKTEGIRVRSGNIMVGDKNILSDFFREARFNNYVVGEIHITHPRLVLNSRRDDFEDNCYKEEFYNNFVKEIGLPCSQKIRQTSKDRSDSKREKIIKQITSEGIDIVKSGYLSEIQYRNVLKELQQASMGLSEELEKQKLEELIGQIKKSRHYLDNLAAIKLTKNELKKVFDTIYKNIDDSSRALKIIRHSLAEILVEK